MDFVCDSLLGGRWLRALTIVENFTRESLAIPVAQGIKAEQVVTANFLPSRYATESNLGCHASARLLTPLRP
jgi:putative transposase